MLKLVGTDGPPEPAPVSNAECERGRTNQKKGKSIRGKKSWKGDSRRRAPTTVREDLSAARGHRSPSRDRVADSDDSRRRSPSPVQEDVSAARGQRSPSRDRVADSDDIGAEKTGKK